MRTYAIRRVLFMVPTLLIVTLVVFFLLRFIPGDLIDVMVNTQRDAGTEEALDRDEILRRLGLDEPIHTQYVKWLGAMVRGDLGKSLWSETNVVESLGNRLPISIELGILALIIELVIAIPVGILAAIRQDTIQDYTSRSLAILFMCVPNFWIATMVMIYPAIWWQWAPRVEYVAFFDNPLGNLGMFIIPALIMGLSGAGSTMRMTRTMMLEVLRQDYIRTAWAKGLRERVVIIRHTLKNALIPVVTMVGMGIPGIIAGTIIMERVFGLPGMGRLMLDALNGRDYTVVSGINVIIATFVLVCNLGVDLTYSFLDPRVRYR